MLSTFLNQERYNDFSYPPVSDKKPIKKMCEWENRISWFSKKGYWSANWGSKPTTDKCEAPKDILEKYGYSKSNPNPEKSK